MKQVKVTANSVLYVVATDNCKLFLKENKGYWSATKLKHSITEALMFDDEKDAKLEARELGLKVYKFYLEFVPTNSHKFEEAESVKAFWVIVNFHFFRNSCIIRNF